MTFGVLWRFKEDLTGMNPLYGIMDKDELIKAEECEIINEADRCWLDN